MSKEKLEKVGRVARLMAAFYIAFFGSISIISSLWQLINFGQSSQLYLQVIQIPSQVVSLVVSVGFASIVYALIKNKREGFLVMMTILLMLAIGSPLLNNALPDNSDIKLRISSFWIFIFYFIPAVLVFLSWKFEKGTIKNSVERAKEILGNNVKGIPDNQLHEMLKHS